MKKFEGKRIIYLYISEIFEDNLIYLKDNGAYLILLSTNTIPDDWPYKEYFNEYISVESLDYKYLIKNVDFKNINAVISVFKEDESPLVKKLNEYIGNKYLFTNKQFKTFSNKVCFRKLCEKYDIPTPKTYFKGSIFSIWKLLFIKFKYPLIIKPADLMGGGLITIVEEKRFFLKDLLRAFKYSHSHGAIIEQYIDSQEISLTYVIKDGVPALSMMHDRYLFTENQKIPRPFLTVFPSKYVNEFLNSLDEKMKKMILDQKLENVSVFFQGKYKDNKFYLFESGLRLEGGYGEYINTIINNQNFVEFLIDNVLKVPTEFDLSKEDPFLKNNIVINYCQVAKPGVISSIDGIEKIKEDDNIIWRQSFRQPGYVVRYGSFLGCLINSFYIKANSGEEFYSIIKHIEETINVIDEKGNDMIIHDVIKHADLTKYKIKDYK